MPGNYPEESIQHSEHGESLKSFSGAVYTLYQSVVKDTKTITKVILITCYKHTGENVLLAKHGTTSAAGERNITNVTYSAVYT
jgi:hypothetical protein